MAQPITERPTLVLLNNRKVKPIYLEERKDRRISKTNQFWDLLMQLFGDPEKFRLCLIEAKIEGSEILLVDLNVTIAEIRSRLKQLSYSLKLVGKFTDSQWNLLHNQLKDPVFGPFLPCTRTIRRYWNKQKGIGEDISNEDFFELVSDNHRDLSSYLEEQEQHYLSISNRFRWMLFLARRCFEDNTSILNFPDSQVEIHVDFLFWYDGARAYGQLFQGLYSAIKIIDVRIFVRKDQNPGASFWVKFDPLLRKFLRRSWTICIQQQRETQGAVAALEKFLLDQWETCRSNSFDWDRYSLVPSLKGITADHGIRQKVNRVDSLQERCGECTAVFDSCSRLDYFLDWKVLLSFQPVSGEKWLSTRFRGDSDLAKRWEDFGISSVLTYDNHHNFCGFVKELFFQIRSLFGPPSDDGTPKKDLKEMKAHCLSLQSQIDKKAMEIAGIKFKSNMNPFDFFKGRHWRKLSLHFSKLFAEFWRKDTISASFDSLFEIVTEIHLFNYLYWNRSHELFPKVLGRYSLILFLLTQQLRSCFQDHSEKLAKLNTMYLHKILIHSRILFADYNLSASSCENGEGSIAIINRYLRQTSGKLPAAMSKVLLQTIIDEEAAILHEIRSIDRNSQVFSKDFLNSYSPKEIRIHWKNSIQKEAVNFFLRHEPLCVNLEKAFGHSNGTEYYTFQTLSGFNACKPAEEDKEESDSDSDLDIDIDLHRSDSGYDPDLHHPGSDTDTDSDTDLDIDIVLHRSDSGDCGDDTVLDIDLHRSDSGDDLDLHHSSNLISTEYSLDGLDSNQEFDFLELVDSSELLACDQQNGDSVQISPNESSELELVDRNPINSTQETNSSPPADSPTNFVRSNPQEKFLHIVNLRTPSKEIFIPPNKEDTERMKKTNRERLENSIQQYNTKIQHLEDEQRALYQKIEERLYPRFVELRRISFELSLESLKFEPPFPADWPFITTATETSNVAVEYQLSLWIAAYQLEFTPKEKDSERVSTRKLAAQESFQKTFIEPHEHIKMMSEFCTAIYDLLCRIPIEIFDHLPPDPEAVIADSLRTWLTSFNIFVIRFKCAHMYLGRTLRQMAEIERSVLVQKGYEETANKKLNSLKAKEEAKRRKQEEERAAREARPRKRRSRPQKKKRKTVKKRKI